jgi:phospholipase C
VGTPCGQSAAPPAQYDHIYLFVFENLSYASFLADNLPYTHALAAACGLATNYSAITHPSLPNYLAMTSGDTQGIIGDPAPTNPGSLTADNIFNEVTLSGGQWRSYSESMPQNCYHADDPPAPNAYYTVHHEPAVYYADIATDCNNWDVPQGTTTSGAMISDISSGTMPTFAFVGPNDDGGCSTCGGDVDPQKLDGYLQQWLPQIFATPSYQAGKTAIFIAWDESDNKTSNQVPMIAIAPSIPAGTQVSDAFNHYSLLRSMEEMLGIPNLLGNAATANSMRSAFNI